METELFGVFGGGFDGIRDPEEFDRVCSSSSLTVGIHDSDLGAPHRSAAHEDDRGCCVIWGEVYLPDGSENAARWVLERYRAEGQAAIEALNGSYLVAIDTGEEVAVYTDPIRSWECFYTDASGPRVFGTDAAAVCRTAHELSLERDSLFELAHISVVLDDRTLVEEVARTPFDGVLRPEGTERLDRFVYRPREFDYAGELADRLQRALSRRADLKGTKGLLLGAGYDSRTLLAGIPGIEHCYTVGSESSAEARVAKKLAEQYGATHRTLPVDGSYFVTDIDTVRYTNGIDESIHIHQRGIEQIANDDVMYHGWAIDSLLKEFFVQKKRVGAFGKSIKLSALPEEPDALAFLTDRKLGIMPDSASLLAECDSGDPDEIERRLERELDRCRERCTRDHDLPSVFGIKNLPSKSFRAHLADRFTESFVCADSELLDWHLSTPPEYRSTETFLDAIQQIDPNILQYRPPDRPRTSSLLNQIEGFCRRNLPFLPFDSPWPDRRSIYREYDLDGQLLSDSPSLHPCSVRLKLRVHDVETWLNALAGEDTITPQEVVCPPESRRITPEPKTTSR
ncbi:hypothetical protein [Halalkalicoccus subterraneus]|uniref:hypothetical protein n=1 Tax=Halalkalicoccus subterraneus TaxID=2675002 RepID=UPI000EFD13ED|nr:hypothetical protein [Halalkalicoccus subterraneus]